MEDLKYVSGEMNLDVSPELLGEGDYAYGRNFVIGPGQHGEGGSIEPMRINQKLNFGAENGDTVVGLCPSTDEKILYVFLRNPDKTHNKIIAYDAGLGSGSVVVASDLLEFDSDLIINNAKEIDGHLYFIDSGKEAKCFSTVEWDNRSLTMEDVCIGRRSMAFAPEYEKFETSAHFGEELPDMLSGYDFQFAVQYVYSDNKQSVLSPMTKLATANLPDDEFKRIRVYLPIIKDQVAIAVTDATTGFIIDGLDDAEGKLSLVEEVPTTVVKINIAVRIGNVGAWNIIDSIDRDLKGDVFERNFTDFKNNTNGVLIPDRYYASFDIIPRTPKTQEFARNRMFYANYVEGYDSPKIDLEASFTETDLPSGGGEVIVTTQLYEQLTSFFTQIDDGDGTCDPGFGRNFRYLGSMFNFIVMMETTRASGRVGTMLSEVKYIDDTAFRHPMGVAVSVSYRHNVSHGAYLQFGSTHDLASIQPGDFIVVPNVDVPDRYVSDDLGCRKLLSGDTLPYSAKVLSVDASSGVAVIDVYGDVDVSENIVYLTSNSDDVYWIRPSEILAATLQETSADPYVEYDHLCMSHCLELDSYARIAEYSMSHESFATGGELDTVKIEMPADVESFDGLKSFSSNSSYRLGIVYKDKFMRPCGVVTNPKAVVDIYSDKYIFNAKINWSIDSDFDLLIPAWAEYYSIVRTINLKKSTFVEYNSADIYYQGVDSNGDPGAPSYVYDPNNVRAVIDISTLISAGKGYTFLEGDRIILYDIIYDDGAGNPVSSGLTWDIPIIKQEDATKIVVANRDLAKGSGDLMSFQAVRYEIYSPRKDPFDSLFFEVGETYKIDRSDILLHHSAYFGVLEGDTINVIRNKYIRDATGIIIDPNSSRELYRSISAQDDNPLAFWNTNIGHAFIIDDVGEVYKGNYFRWSNVLLQDTKINGLNEFDPLDEKRVPSENGNITALRLTSKVQEAGTVMLAVGELSPSSIYLGEKQWTDIEGRVTSALTEDTVGTVRPQANEYGCVSQESVIAIKGKVYWFDESSKNFVEYNVNGTKSLSKFRTGKHFDQVSGRVVTFFDPFYSMLFISAFESSVPIREKTIGYDFDQGKWRCYFDVRPRLGVYMGDILYTARLNEMWRHTGDGVRQNNFYGIDFPMEIVVSFNKNSFTPKEWDSIALVVSDDFIQFVTMPPEINDPDFKIEMWNRLGQETDLIAQDFDVDDFVVYSDILMDKNSVGGLMEGSKMVGNTLQLRLHTERNNPFQIFYFRVGYNISKGHKLQ